MMTAPALPRRTNRASARTNRSAYATGIARATATVACLTVASLAVIGCDSAPATNAVSVDTLASGTIVVENHGEGLWGERPWRLELVTSIGSMDGGGPDAFGLLYDVVLGPDERVYALDAMAGEVRAFDLDGHHVATIGRRGRGPGEFSAPYAIAFDPDGKLWVTDQLTQRYTVFEDDGSLGRTFRRVMPYLTTPGMFTFASDGTVLEAGSLDRERSAAVRFEVGDSIIARDTTGIPRVSAQTFLLKGAGAEPMGKRIPFTPLRNQAIGSHGEVWFGIGDRYEIARLAPNGDTLLIARRDVPPTPVSTAERAAIEDDLADWRSKDIDVDESRIPDVHPFFDMIVVDDDANLWVHRLTPDGRQVFDVFDEDARYLGELPGDISRFPMPHITSDYMAAVTQDSFDVQHVEVYRMVKNEP